MMDFLKKYQDIYLEHYQRLNWDSQPKTLYGPIKYILDLGGKRIRPILVLMAYDLYKNDIFYAVDGALAVEIFHNFTLVHDDIMDNAKIRRGSQTVHEKYGVNSAILSGDTMIIKSYELLNKYPSSKDLFTAFNKMAIQLCEGQRLDMDYENLDEVAIMDYIQMISNKTAVLLACSLQIGCILGGGSKNDQSHLYEFGKNIGIAFQIQDDILDTFGDQSVVGKMSGGDIIENKKTYLYLKALELSTDKERKDLIDLYHDDILDPKEKIAAVKKRFGSLVVEEYANQVKEAYYNLAISHLTQIGVDNNQKKSLTKLANFMIQRNH